MGLKLLMLMYNIVVIRLLAQGIQNKNGADNAAPFDVELSGLA